MLRITGGIHNGQRISPIHSTVRPIMERVRTAFFTRIDRFIDMEEMTMLDLFGGSGIMGLEALSRGAASVTVCERSRPVFRCIEQCYHRHVADANTYRLYHIAAERFLDRNRSSFNLIVVDPPYNYQYYADLLARVHRSLSVARSIIAVFHQAHRPLHAPYQTLTADRYGDTTITLLQHQ